MGMNIIIYESVYSFFIFAKLTIKFLVFLRTLTVFG